ncbi:MAG: acyltransferase [Bradyrhizobiaceae bacterium]|jgi:peptidoglycan/LPS O-acetylase OafA/YrhL|nr:MAG: acyltransferase [Bradyrhizobiaceae bacterium]
MQDAIVKPKPRPVRVNGTSTGRFDALDGMRGAAAITVLLFHFRYFFPNIPVPPNGYLAVDLFFGLSGFVLVHAYGAEMTAGLTVRQFMRMRFARLYPMYILGTGLTVALLSLSLPRSASNLLPLGFAAFMLPSPITEQLYPLNVPAWSLFLELLINVALVVLWKRLTVSIVLSICVVSALCLIGSAVHYGGLDFGHKWEAFAVGLARVTYSFFLGVALQLTGARVNRVPPLLSMAILLAIFLLPAPAGWSVAWDLLAVLVAFPLLLAAGAYVQVGSLAARLCKWSGEISYPLYATHNPILVWCYALSRKFDIAITPLTVLAIVAITIVSAWMAEIFFDKPIRSRLRARLDKARPNGKVRASDHG